jgi:hypothetical protein
MSNIKLYILKNKSGRGSLLISHEKYIKESNVLFNLEIRSNVLLHKPTHALKSLKGPGNTLDLNPKRARTLPSLIYFSWHIYRNPPPDFIFQISNLIFDTLLWAKYQILYFRIQICRGISITIQSKIY